MSTFTVTPGVAYNIAIGQPGVSGTPTPTVSYAWTYNGSAIGGNSRFVTGYTFPSFPGTLACTITLTNIVGSVSQTVTATIDQVANLPSLSPVTIRNNAAPTVPINTIANGNAGVVLRVGGPTAPDLNPIAPNANTIAYQWRRGTANIAGATAQTYTLVAADEDETISVVVTATNLEGTASRTAAVVVGDALPNATSRIGSHLPSLITHSAADIAFTNLMYSAQLKWLGGNRATSTNPSTLWEDYTGDPFCTVDGWPIKNIDGTPLSTSKKAEIWLSVNSDYRGWSILQIPGEYTTPTEGENPLPPDNIRGKWVKYTIAAYWQGSGKVRFISESIASAGDITEQSVTFSGPLNEGPWGTGPVAMTMRKWEARGSNADCKLGQLHVYIEETDPNDPVRNMVVLVKDVRWWLRNNDQDEGVLGGLVYEGTDHTSYRPYDLYPGWYEKNKRMRILRNHGQTKVHHGDNIWFASPVAESFERGPGEFETVRRIGWLHSANSYGFETGYGAMNRPTHVCHGVSLKAQVEICNRLQADWWHSHPANAVYAGTRSEGVPDVFAGNGETKPLLVDQDYITNLVTFVSQSLAPGLKIYSESCNEYWNSRGSFAWNHGWAYWMGERAKADAEHGGDGGPIFNQGSVGAGGIFASQSVTNSMFNRGKREKVFSYAAAALLAKEMRSLMPSGGPEVVATAGAQFSAIDGDAKSVGNVFLRVPILFRELDALAIAPYRNPFFDPGIDPPGLRSTSIESDQNLVALGSTEAAWDWVVSEHKHLEPYSSPIGELDGQGNEVVSQTSFWSAAVDRSGARINYHAFTAWKHLALDQPFTGDTSATSYKKYHVPSSITGRRWNLKLVAYESGNHYIPNFFSNPDGPRAKELTAGVVMEPRYRIFMRRYYETLFAPNIRGLTRDPVSGTTEDQIYRPGMVPDGIAQDREPILDHCVLLTIIDQPLYREGMYWGLAWFTSQINSPQAVGLDESVDLGIGTTDWWVNYTGYLE